MLNASAQNAELMTAKRDSLRQNLTADSIHIFRKRLAKPFLKIENRYSFISNENINLFGIMGGATFIEKHTIFTGYFFLDPRRTTPISFAERGINTQHYLDMNYFVLGYQYVFISKRYFQVNAPLATGYGTYKVEVTDNYDNPISSKSGNIWPTNAGLQLIIKPLKWIGVSASGGYRYIGNKVNTELVLRGWYYSFGLWLDGRQIYRSARLFNKRRIYRREISRLQ
jgi:hypothetical protein